MLHNNSILQNEFNILNPEQKRAVLHQDGPLLVLAGAGSGKTKVVAVRIARLIADGIAPNHIVGVTFTNKAAQEMKERVASLVGSSTLISTFHSLGAKLLRESIHHLGYSPNFVIYDEEDSTKFLKSLVKEVYGTDTKIDLKAAQRSISATKNNLGLGLDPVYSPLYDLYLQRMKAANSLDFDDLLFLPVILFRTFAEVLAQYQSRWHYLLVDEYQDTNFAQYELVRLLVSGKRNLFVVGDPDQSIYSWRGANIGNILHFEKDYPGATIVRLEQNYRSTKTILSAANSVIKNNQLRYEKALWSSHEEGNKISIFEGETERDEASFVARTVNELLHGKNIPLHEMVIFYRTNFQSRSFEDELIAKKIPYTIIGGISFYHRKEIKDILAFLRLLEYPNDLVSFLRVVNQPKRGFGDKFLSTVVDASTAQNIPLMELFALETPPISLTSRQKEGWKDFAHIMAHLQEIKASQPLSELVRAAISDTRYLEVLDADPETKDEKRQNVAELVAKALEWQEDHEEGTLQQFLEEIALTTSTDSMQSATSRLNLMTVHNGKGLEFQAVFLVGMEEELFPHINSKKSPEELEEERRLFYVGLTRAKKLVTATHTSFRHLWGGFRTMRPSRFLFEIPPQFRQKIGASILSSYSRFSSESLD